MSARRPLTAPRPGAALHHDPLGEEQILERFYRPQGEAEKTPNDDPLAAGAVAKKARPTHYKIVCISLYREDLEHVLGTFPLIAPEIKQRVLASFGDSH